MIYEKLFDSYEDLVEITSAEAGAQILQDLYLKRYLVAPSSENVFELATKETQTILENIDILTNDFNKFRQRDQTIVEAIELLEERCRTLIESLQDFSYATAENVNRKQLFSYCNTKFAKQFPALQDEFESVIFGRSPRYTATIDSLCLIVITKPVTLLFDSAIESPSMSKDLHFTKEVKLGRFALCFNNFLGDGHFFSVIALEPNYAHHNQYPHPYVSSTSLCLGEGGKTFRDRVTTFDFDDALSIANSVLNSYKPTNLNPYCRLFNWIGVNCSCCDNIGLKEEMIQCSYDYHYLCKKCAPKRTCEICGRVMCTFHTGTKRKIFSCQICEKTICGYCATNEKKHRCIIGIPKNLIVYPRYSSLIKFMLTQEELETIRKTLMEQNIPQKKVRKRRKRNIQENQEENVSSTTEPTVNVVEENDGGFSD